MSEEDSSHQTVVSEDALTMARLYAWLSKREQWEQKFVQTMSRNPFESLMIMLIGGSTLFYQAEFGTNPNVKNFWDALYFITTCASVGYADLHAQTKTGKALASFVMTFGPTLASSALETKTAQVTQQTQPSQLQEVIGRLDAILLELRQMRKGTTD